MTHVYKQRRIVQDPIRMNHLLACFGKPRTVPIDPELAAWKVTKEEGQSTLGHSCYPAIAPWKGAATDPVDVPIAANKTLSPNGDP